MTVFDKDNRITWSDKTSLSCLDVTGMGSWCPTRVASFVQTYWLWYFLYEVPSSLLRHSQMPRFSHLVGKQGRASSPVLTETLVTNERALIEWRTNERLPKIKENKARKQKHDRCLTPRRQRVTVSWLTRMEWSRDCHLSVPLAGSVIYTFLAWACGH